MAQDDTEVEIKIPVSKPTFRRVNKELQGVGKYVGKSHQLDTYYSPCHRNFLDPEVPFEWLSIRQRNRKTILNYKHWYKEQDGFIHSHCDEYETEVIKKDQLNKIFKVLNIKKIVEVDKIRYVYKVDKMFEVCLDEVKGLGYFIEIEAMDNDSSVKKTQNKLEDFAKKLGLKLTKQVPGGYAFAVLQKMRGNKWIFKT